MVTQEDQKNWKIPPCVSSWKNSRGYTLPLHQRLAADGRSLQNHAINDKFAKFTESLHMAERQARYEVEERAKMRLLLAKKKKQEMEKELTNIAKAVKQTFQKKEHSNSPDSDHNHVQGKEKRRDVRDYDKEKEERTRQERERKRRTNDSDNGEDEDEDAVTEKQIRDRQARDKIRQERAKERKREFRLEQSKHHSSRQRERDITEKIALQQLNTKKSGESVFDQRLFNQESGIGSGFEIDDCYVIINMYLFIIIIISYNLYDKPLFNATSKKIYRPKHMDLEMYGNEEEHQDIDKLLEQSSKFKPHKGFEGAEAIRGQRHAGAPVEFVKAGIDADDVNYSKNLVPGLQENKKAPTKDETRQDKGRYQQDDGQDRQREDKRERDRYDREQHRDSDNERRRPTHRDRERDDTNHKDRHRDKGHYNRHRDREHDRHRDHGNDGHKEQDREHDRRRRDTSKDRRRRRSHSHSRSRSQSYSKERHHRR
ncbi:hypothetical protein RFI_11289 [Reticulomyxa filosa]|uniref:SKI-interacting protein SKIP SNW domain-containing protein n=1 Tax=Reticulomyxa filosa TaxID=46433 RepID=X6NKF8_RETFI|nr:hypothetical protein RFI_11289 [Reticulomyxa filosa]|eukprot:ETO25847.1 hypothetical protein RFI_11289 [Reticulomyxa filosa]